MRATTSSLATCSSRAMRAGGLAGAGARAHGRDGVRARFGGAQDPRADARGGAVARAREGERPGQMRARSRRASESGGRARARAVGTKNRADVETMEASGRRTTERAVGTHDGGGERREWSSEGLFARKDSDGEFALGGGAEMRATWSLGLLTVAYCHASATGFLLPSLLPVMSMDLKLDDGQGAVLTTLFTVTYSLLLPFVGVLADTVNRKNLLACGAATWTAASFMTAHSENFAALVLSRGMFAIGNSPQNPVAFSMIPELFPRNKNIALSVYNLAIHAGRAVSFASGAFVGRAPLPPGADAHVFSNDPITLPLTYLTEIGALGAHTILYTTADSVVLTPNVGTVLENTVGGAMMSSSGMSWEQIFDIVALPGLVIVPLVLLTISDPGRTAEGSRSQRRAKRAKKKSADREEKRGVFSSLTGCFKSDSFKKITMAATLADVAGWSMIAFQAAFYERVFSLTPQEYDPLLALVIPVAGVTGGLGGGWICDKLQSTAPNAQRLFISSMTFLAGPLLAASLLADDYKTSLLFLFPGMVAAEIFRSPTAVMTREALPGTPSVAAAAHLAVRNMVAGVGPLAVAFLASKYDLQHAMLFAPVFYAFAGVAYFDAIGTLTEEKERIAAAEQR